MLATLLLVARAMASRVSVLAACIVVFAAGTATWILFAASRRYRKTGCLSALQDSLPDGRLLGVVTVLATLIAIVALSSVVLR
jgi:hypothetical protein